MKYPRGRLAVPHQAVADDIHAVLLAERDVLVGGPEIVAVWLGVNLLPLQVVLRADGIELRGDQLSIAAGHLPRIHRGTNQKRAIESILQCGGRRGLSSQHRQNQQESSFHTVNFFRLSASSWEIS